MSGAPIASPLAVYYGGDASVTIDRLPPPLRPPDRPSAYVPSAGLVAAANVALLLGKPLLLTGEPGTGKTQFAYHLAAALSGPDGAPPVCEVRKFETKSTSQGRDLFYTFDSLSAFKRPEEADLRAFIDYQALGAAILDAFPADDPRAARLLKPGREGYAHRGQRRTIVLVDEIDKAPSDFPNDILNEIDRLYFRVPELNNIGSPGTPGGPAEQEAADAEALRRYRPILILTSNEERGLPDAFLRRCVFFDIPPPTRTELEAIVRAQLGAPALDQRLVADALDLFLKLRGEAGGMLLRKKPSTAELLNWLQVLDRQGFGAESRLRSRPDTLAATLSALMKTREDAKAAHDYVRERWLKEPESAPAAASDGAPKGAA